MGTIWYSNVDQACEPEYLRGVGIVFILLLSFLYVAIGLTLLLIFALMFFERYQAISALHLVMVPNDDHRVDSLTRSLIEQLDMHTSTVCVNDLYCPICYDDMPVISTQSGSIALKLPGCGHEMHSECVQEWFEIKSSCPVCRDNVAESFAGNY